MRNVNANNNSNHQNQARNPHYENIYESIDQFATVNAPAPADNLPTAQLPNANNNNGRINLRTRNNFHYKNNVATFAHPRNGAYDVPRQARNYYAANINTASRRATLEANWNRARYANANRVAVRQRSFDDTESYHYSHNNNFRYENIYEQIREEPIYRNIGLNRDNAANRLYGRVDVIGHGIGRIERHLSSSCGNIDHYNLGGTYAILGHSHLSTVGHVYASNNAKESAGKSLNFFSCLGRENSQSMSNICGESSNGNAQEAGNSATQQQQQQQQQPQQQQPPPQQQQQQQQQQAAPPQQNENANKHTGAIPKIKSKIPVTNSNQMRNTIQHPIHSTALNRISKSSLQWLLMNKWLPLWIGNGSDCNMLDFNFMFSRNCDGCERDDNVIVYDQSNSVAYANGYRDSVPENHFNASRPRCYHNSLMRFNETNPHRMYRSNRRPTYRSHDAENGNYNPNGMLYHYRATPPPENPFRQWELNSENNSFRPASVRRITDGTFPNGNSQNGNSFSLGATVPNQSGNSQEVRVEINNQPLEAVASTSSAALSTRPVASTSTNNNAEASTSSLRSDRRAFENGALSSSTESTSETETKVRSPDLSGRRYSENTEDDQYNSGNSSCTDDDGNDETISELHTNDTDNSERINDQSN